MANLLWGALYPAAKPALAEVSSLHIALVRAVVAFLVLTAVALALGQGAQIVEELRRRPLSSVVLGLLSFSLSSFLAMEALEHLPASVMGLISNASPLWLAVGTLLVLRPPDSWRLLSGAVIAFLGMGLVLFPDVGSLADLSASNLDTYGVALGVLCGIVIALSTLWGRYALRHSDPLVVTALAAFWGAIPLAFAAGGTEALIPIFHSSLKVKGLLLFLGVGCTAINFALWFQALRRVPAARASAFQYLVPLVTAVLAFVFLNEVITYSLAVGGAFIIGGIALAQERVSREKQPAS